MGFILKNEKAPIALAPINFISQKRSLMDSVSGEVNNIISTSYKNADDIIVGFLQKVSQQKDTKGQSNPRVVRSYIHTMLPGLKNSTEFQKLGEDEKMYIMNSISKRMGISKKKKY